MSENSEVLLKQEERFYHDENCPGCKVDKLKDSNHGLPLKHLFYVFLIVLSTGNAHFNLSLLVFSLSARFLVLENFLMEDGGYCYLWLSTFEEAGKLLIGYIFFVNIGYIFSFFW